MPGHMRAVLSLTKIRNGERKWIKPPLHAASVAERKGTTPNPATCKTSHRGHREGTPRRSCCLVYFAHAPFAAFWPTWTCPWSYWTEQGLVQWGREEGFQHSNFVSPTQKDQDRAVEKGKKTFVFVFWSLRSEQVEKARQRWRRLQEAGACVKHRSGRQLYREKYQV